jgi:hypothetical protein
MNWRRPALLLPIVAAVSVALTGFLLQSRLLSGGLTRAAFAATASDSLFTPIATVLRDPRCMNCHPVGDRPRQGDDRHFHLQNVTRGPDDLGFVNLRCTACHRDENNAYSGVPGAPAWHLAPLSMGWEGLNDAQLCTVLKDKSKNGGRDVAALVEHMSHDKVVLWGWRPGGKRKPVSTPHDEFVKQLKAWAGAGAPCPTATP